MATHLFKKLIKLTMLGVVFAATSPPLAKPNCQSHCGNISIPYPFGTSDGCYLDADFLITCNTTFNPPKPFLTIYSGNNIGLTNKAPLELGMINNIEVLQISLEGQLKISSPVVYNCNDSLANSSSVMVIAFTLSKFSISNAKNKFTIVGCDTMSAAFISHTTSSAECNLSCNNITDAISGSCSGIGCCQTVIPKGLKSIGVGLSSNNNHTSVRDFNPCTFAFVGEDGAFNFSSLDLYNLRNRTEFPLVLDWTIGDQACDVAIEDPTSYACKENSKCTNSENGPGYLCSCKDGFQGNPYLTNGCQGSNPKVFSNGFALGICTGVVALLFLSVGAWWLYKVIKKRKDIKLKQKFFKRNGGLLLQQQLSSGEVNVEKIKMFNSKELEKATDRFNVDRMLGQGGQGTVYKGMLADGRIVAVKKSKVVDKGKLEQFINEVVILSQINHRNVVKLLGCCLETEVPLLVYEFIPNGTLYQYLHDQNEEFPLTWDIRLRIAIEVSGALSYLHSAASLPIYHRDIKSTNILLDDKYRVRVADFGISKSVTIDQTHVTTQVQGTFGYLDPQYFQSSQFTEKSDVYSFGVVLVELLTGQKPISFITTQEVRSLATYFLSIEENHLFDILDVQVMKEDRNEIMVAAKLAKRCLNLNGKQRPTMNEVKMELEGIQKSRKAFNDSQNYEAIEEPWNVASTSTGSGLDNDIASSVEEPWSVASTSERYGFDNDKPSSFEIEPLLFTI